MAEAGPASGAVRRPVFLDNHSTTPLDPRVLERMLPYFTEKFGNPASRHHAFGWAAEAAVEAAREQVADLLGAAAREIVFTSGATESNNLALKGAAAVYAARGRHIVTQATEHKSVLDPCARLEREGFRVTRVRPGRDGRVSPEAVAAALAEDTILVSVMQVNSEIGVIQPVAEIAAAAKAARPAVIVHCDAVQAAGKLPVDVGALGVDLLSVSAHKMYGPKGVGALWVRRRPRIRLAPLIDGGGQERGMRSGTLPVPQIVGFGAACELAGAEMAEEAPRLLALRERLRGAVTAGVAGVFVNGSLAHRVPGNLNLSFAGVDGEALIMGLRDIAVSSGSACASATLEPSYVLRAIGVDEALAHASIRFGIGRFNSEEEIDFAAARVISAVERLRAARSVGGGAAASNQRQDEM